MEDMKANELMIGDKVMVKVLSQIPDTYVLHTWTANDYSRDIQVKPIKLTPEILEKNGWEEKAPTQYRHNCCICIDILDDSCYCVYNYFDSFPYCKINLTIHYVHELQHALRLCGLNSLADNFKI